MPTAKECQRRDRAEKQRLLEVGKLGAFKDILRREVAMRMTAWGDADIGVLNGLIFDQIQGRRGFSTHPVLISGGRTYAYQGKELMQKSNLNGKIAFDYENKILSVGVNWFGEDSRASEYTHANNGDALSYLIGERKYGSFNGYYVELSDLGILSARQRITFLRLTREGLNMACGWRKDKRVNLE